MTAAASPASQAAAVISPVLLVLVGGTVSEAAIYQAARLAQGGRVTVVGVGCGPGAGGPGGSAADAEPEQVRRAVALAMSVLEDIGVVALGHIAATGAPGRTVARVARARGARVVVLDQAAGGVTQGRGGAGATRGLAVELRRRMYGAGITVVTATDRGVPRARPA